MRKLFLCVGVLPLLVVGMVRAQANRATVTGTVTDSSGAVIVGVEVSAKNLGTDVVTHAVTNADGIYVVPNLPPGAYSITFRKNGFKALERPSITLDSTEVTQINGALQVGAAIESIMVTADAPVIDRENAAIGTNMKGDVVTDLPLSIYNGGRFVENFAVAITPGYSPISNPYESVVNGTQGFTKDFTVDGTSATATIQGDSMEIGPSMEAVQELQAQTSGIDAESGITSGGIIALNLKSGTNKFHGSAFGYGHNELLDANSWTNDLTGATKTKARAWDYGGSVGGPIRKNKTFFFGTFERYTQNDFSLGGFTQFVPTQAFLNGDFSALLDTTKNLGTDIHGNPIYAGAIFNPKDPGAVFVGNKIPTTMFSSVAQKIIPIFQKYYAPESTSLFANNRLPSNNSPAQTPNQAVIKLDHTLSGKDRLSGSWIYNHRPRTLVDSGGIWEAGSTDGGPLADDRVQLVRAYEFRASESHTLAPNLLNVFNATYNWYWNGNNPTSTGTNWASQLGLGNTGADNFPSISFGSSVNNYSVTSIGNTWQNDYSGAIFIYGDSLSWSKGRHTFTFGGDFRAYQINSHTGSGALNFNFLPSTTGAPGASYSSNVGFGFATFLLGDVTNAKESTPYDLYGRRKATSLFAQDNWKLTPKLTLNLGLRWEYTFRFHEKYGHWANFDLTAIDPKLGIPCTLVFAKNGSDSFEKNEYPTNFGPQLGFAYSPWKKWVFRGSFGILYVPIGTQHWEGTPYGFAPGFQGTNQTNAAFNWDSGYPGVFVPGNKNVDITQFCCVVASIDPRALRAGYTDGFNIGVQYEITPTMRIEAAYIGNRGHRLPDTALNYNEPSAKTFFGFINMGNSYNPYSYNVCSAANAASFGIKYPYPGFCGDLYQAIAPYPQLAGLMDTYYYDQLYYVGLPLAQTYYNSMVIDLKKRAGRGLTMDLNYTLSRQEGDTYTAFQETYADYTPIQDFSNIAQAAHTITNYDQTHVVKGLVTYELPFGRGRQWISNRGRLVNSLVGGWTVAGLVLYTSGQPFQAGVPNPYYAGWGNIYPNFNLSGFSGPIFKRGQYTPPTPTDQTPASDFYLPADVVTAPAYGQFGTGPSAISALRCPGSANENASILKYFSMGSDGQYKLSFRTEFYNLFNRHYFGIQGCGGGHAQASAGQPLGFVTGVNSAPRTGQFAVRFTF